MHKQKMFRVKEIEDKLNEAIRQQEHKIQSKEYEEGDPDLKGYTDLVLFNLNTTGSVLTDTNDVDIFTDGNEKFDALIQDIREAKEFIHIQYYIIKMMCCSTALKMCWWRRRRKVWRCAFCLMPWAVAP